MSDLISRSALLAVIKENPCWTYNSQSDAMDIVQAAPAVDAVPVVHGRWVHDGQRIHNGVDWWHCSECNKTATGVEIEYNYCPNCGAKMDGERKDNEV